MNFLLNGSAVFPYTPLRSRVPGLSAPTMRCPYCHSSDIWKLQPMPWMGRVRPRFKNRRCSNCGHEFAVWYGVSMKHAAGKRIVFLCMVVWAFLLVLVGTDLFRLCVNPRTSWIHQGIEVVRNLWARESSPERKAPAAVPDEPTGVPTDLSRF